MPQRLEMVSRQQGGRDYPRDFLARPICFQPITVAGGPPQFKRDRVERLRYKWRDRWRSQHRLHVDAKAPKDSAIPWRVPERRGHRRDGDTGRGRRRPASGAQAFVRTMNAVESVTQVEGPRAERIVRPADHMCREIRSSSEHVRRRAPIRPRTFGGHRLGSAPAIAFSTDAHAVASGCSTSLDVVKCPSALCCSRLPEDVVPCRAQRESCFLPNGLTSANIAGEQDAEG